MSLDIVTIEKSPNCDILRKPTKKIDFPLSTEIKDLIQAMKEKHREIQGVGLAANQVGYACQLIIVEINEEAMNDRTGVKEAVPETVLINPSLEPIPDAGLSADWERCFSVTEWVGKVPRYNSIWYQAWTEQGEFIRKRADGFFARVLQHEIDHLNGLLIIDRLTSDCLQGSIEEMLPHILKEREGQEASKVRGEILD